MEKEEGAHLIIALYDFAWKIAELESGPQLMRLSKEQLNDKLTEEATEKVTGRIGITKQELHSIIQQMSSKG
jgi:hypothetical protein